MFKSTSRGRAAAAPPSRASVHPFHAVEVVSGPAACAAALARSGDRYLSREFPPQLPLAQCDRSAQCTCRYQHHDDRRGGPRRSMENGRPAAAWLQGERRTRRGRRRDD